LGQGAYIGFSFPGDTTQLSKFDPLRRILQTGLEGISQEICSYETDVIKTRSAVGIVGSGVCEVAQHYVARETV